MSTRSLMQTSEILQAALDAEGEVRDIFLRAARVQDLQERIRGCVQCDLSGSATAPVPAEGFGSVTIVGEAPGADEDRAGRPFIGRAGKLLDECLNKAGLARKDVGLVNTICCRPPRNNYQMAIDAQAPRACKPLFIEQLEMTGSWLLVPVGNTAMRQLLPELEKGITSYRGKWWWRGRHLIMPTYHPAYALRNPDARTTIITDLMAVRRVVQGVEAAPVPKGYDPTMLLTDLRDEMSEAHEKAYRVQFKKKNWVIFWSPWLEDSVVLRRDEDTMVPSHVKGVRYTVQELTQLSHMERTWADVHRLHHAKKVFDAQLI